MIAFTLTERPIIILNDKTSYTALGKYSALLSEALNGQLLTIINDTSKPVGDFPGTIIQTKPRLVLGSGYNFSLNNPDKFYRKAVSAVSERLDKNGIIHYSSPGIPPLFEAPSRVVTIHDIFPTMKEGIEKATFLKFINFEHVVAVSAQTKIDAEEIGFTGNVKVIYSPIAKGFYKLDVPRDQLRKELNLPLDKKLILSVSIDTPMKNLKMVNETMKALGDDFKLVRVGSQIGNCISFKNIPIEQLNRLYNCGDVLLFPSLREGFGFPVVEAMRTALPVVCSDIPVFREISDNVPYFSEISPKGFSEKIKEAINTDENRLKLGVEQSMRFDMENYKKNMRSYYKHEFNVGF